ncbi:ABC transporter substrate-binding protein [bacterium]|nr:ABC transporter substrate-binding protein [bacterium]
MLRYTKYIAKVIYLSVALCASSLAIAGEQIFTSDENVSKAVTSQFAPLFTAITQELSENQGEYLLNPVAYVDFINKRVKSHWDITSTTSALVGKGQFLALRPQDQDRLVAAMDTTLMRYAFEGLEHYSAQIFDVVSVVINKQGSLGWVQVRVRSPILMDLNLDLLIKRSANNGWKAVDVRFKGITYVAIKKHEYRQMMAQDGVEGLIETLQQRNTDFFADVCAKVSSQSKDTVPC